PNSMWRYAPVLPPAETSVVTLGEGMTPLIGARRLGARLGAQDLWIKDEGLNPTGSFKARGLACAVSMAVELGVKKMAIPSAGNAASALAAYAAAAGIEAHIFMPRDVPQANYIECQAFGAFVTLVDGLIGDCAKQVAAGGAEHGWYDVSTLKEPYRIEGKKTMGYEVAEQFDWQLPDAIFYPTGGGVGMIGMWKAFDQMEAVGGGAARAKAAGRLPDPGGGARERRHGAGGERRRTAGRGHSVGARGRRLRRAGGRRVRGRAGEAAGFRFPEACGADRHLQHGGRGEVSGSLRYAVPADGLGRA